MSKTKTPPRSPDWPFDRSTLASPEVQAALVEHGKRFDDITIPSLLACALVGPRRTRIGDKDVTLRRVAELLGEGDAHRIGCGLHSGFPPCCIRFFIETDGRPLDRHYKIAMEAARPLGYLPCPVCLREKRFVEVRRCNCNADFYAVVARAAGAPVGTRPRWRP
jgi:hypothetical protein